MNFLDGSIEKGKGLFFVEKDGGVRLPVQKKDEAKLRKQIRTYLKNLFARLCGLGGLNLTAENAKERKDNLASEQPMRIFEMASSHNVYLGIRPESIQMVGSGGLVGSRTKVKVAVEVVEPTGE
jgi:hypothetical protein